MAITTCDPAADRRGVMDRIATTGHIVRRAAWRARPPRKALEPDWCYDSIVVHYSGHGNLGSMKAIQDFDLDHRAWDDIAYHYGIMPDGRIYEGREIVAKGAHILKQNTGKIGIVCIGNFDSGFRSLLGGDGWNGDPVQPAMLASLRRLSQILIGVFPIRLFGGHMEFGDSDTCPGDQLLPAVRTMRDQLRLVAPGRRSL